MAFRNMGGNRRNDNRGYNDRGNNGYGNMSRPSINPWENNAGGGGNFRQGGGGGGGGGGSGVNNDVLSLANSLVNNLLRNNQPPSLLDLPQRGGGGYGNQMNFGRFDDRNGRMGNRNAGNRRPGQGARNNNAKFGGPIKGGIRKRNAVDRTKKVLAKNAAPKDPDTPADSNDKPKESGKKDNAAKKESKYADVPNVMFYCHMCKKHMWDATSFENHVKGRTHLMMREGVEESYRLKANMIRQEAKIEEQLKTIELERLKRMGKAGKGNFRREYCTMCDLNFHGHLTAHRKTDGHLNLKKFLHPKCLDCNQEFPNRIDFDGHILSPEHMKRAFVTKANKPEKRKNALTIYTEEDELKDLKEEKEEKKKEKKAAATPATAATPAAGEESMETDENAAEGAEVKKENGDGEETEEKGDVTADEVKEGEEDGEKAAEPAVEADDIILDYEDGDEIPTEVDGRIPKYNCGRQVGPSLIHKLDCYECWICGRFFDSEKTSEIHTRTVTHHRNFVKFLNEKANDTRIAQKRAAAAAEEIERKKKKLEAAAAAEEAEKNGEKKEGDEAYDPTEATDDAEDEKADADVSMEAEGEDDGAEAEGEGEAEAEEAEAEAEAETAENGDTAAPAAVVEEPKLETTITPQTPSKRPQRGQRGRRGNARL